MRAEVPRVFRTARKTKLYSRAVVQRNGREQWCKSGKKTHAEVFRRGSEGKNKEIVAPPSSECCEAENFWPMGSPHTADVVGCLSVPSLVEGRSTSCSERGDARGLVPCPGVMESDAAV